MALSADSALDTAPAKLTCKVTAQQAQDTFCCLSKNSSCCISCISTNGYCGLASSVLESKTPYVVRAIKLYGKLWFGQSAHNVLAVEDMRLPGDS